MLLNTTDFLGDNVKRVWEQYQLINRLNEQNKTIQEREKNAFSVIFWVLSQKNKNNDYNDWSQEHRQNVEKRTIDLILIEFVRIIFFIAIWWRLFVRPKLEWGLFHRWRRFFGHTTKIPTNIYMRQLI